MAQWPEAAALQSDKLERFEMVKEAVAGIRTVRKEQNIANKDSIDLMVVPGEKGYVPEFNPVLERWATYRNWRFVRKRFRAH